MPESAPELRDLVRAAERVAADAGLDGIAARLRESRAGRDRPGTRVAVVGDFNRGKSTLINRLIGADLLPTGTAPLTKALVVVRAVDDGPARLEVTWPEGSTERRWLAGNDPWQGLVLDGPAQVIGVGDGQEGPQEPRLLLSVPSPWLASLELELIDTPGLHAGRVDHLLQTARAVALSDVVIVAISAPSPLSLLERDFLAEELLTKRVPHIIAVLTKADQLPEAEVADFSDWFMASVADISPDIDAMLGPGLAPGGEAELAALRDRISTLARATNVIRRRDQRLAWQLGDACATIRSAAQAAIDQLARGGENRRAAILAAKQQLDDDDLRWSQLRIELDERKLRFAGSMRDWMLAWAPELFETLEIELSRVGDVKAWWEKDVPVRLRRELRSLMHSLEGQISRTVAADLTWLSGEVAADFAVGRTPADARPVIPVTVSEVPDLELDDLHRRRMLFRIVGAAGGIVGSAAAFACGVSMPVTFTIGGSAIATIVAERSAETKIDEQRAKVREHLHLLLDDVVVQYQAMLAAAVNRSYRAAFDDLRDAQASGRTARFEAIASIDDGGPDSTAWTAIQRRIAEIVSQIPADFDDEPDAGLGLCDLDDVDQDPVKETFT